MSNKPSELDPTSYANLVNLLSVFTEAESRMKELEAKLQDQYLSFVDDVRDEYATLQQQLADTEEAVEELAILNPQWFAKQRSVKTPYGTVSFRRTTKLVIKNEEATIILIEQLPEEEQAKFLRVKKELNLEALEDLDDVELKKLRITRDTSDACKVAAAKLDLGKAVKKAKKEDEGKAA